MPFFIYTAMDSSGKELKGRKDMPDEEALTNWLKEQGMFPTSIKQDKGKPAKKAAAPAAKLGQKKKTSAMQISLTLGPAVIKPKALVVVTRQLAILLNAGLPLIRALHTLEKQSKDPIIKKVLGQVASGVEGGATFSESLAQHPKSFDKLYLNMVRAGEAAGKLELILDRLAMFMEKASKIAGKVKSAMVYPSVVLGVAGLITTGLMVFIVPKFQKTFTELLEGAPLPGITQAVMGASEFMQQKWYILIAVIFGVIVAFKLICKTPYGKFARDFAVYNMPLFGPIVSRSAISKFARTLGTLLGSGVPVLSALAIVKETSGNEVVSQAVQKIHDAVKEGENMAGPLAATKIFPEMVVSMIEVGEETGKLPDMMTKIADTYDEEVDNAVSSLTSMIEPLMMVGLAGVVGTLVIALFAPMITIIEKLGG